ncbi:TPA: hypothetical protein JAX15_004604 [Enterobacter roggenkampii]|nr:hypothetical protein [Enterobacter roggenkampii]HAT7722957.1 hypothetical protein [Enterobacter roggenkampii]
MSKYALIKEGVVINCIEWSGPGDNGENQIDFGEGVTAVEIPQGSGVGIGWLYDGSTFTNPNQPSGPSNYDKYKSELEVINKIYQSDIATMTSAWGSAGLFDGSTEAAKKTALQSQATTRKAQYLSDVAALKIKYGV